MLKVQLSAAYYHVVQTEGIDGLLPLVRRSRPDLIITAMALQDGTAMSVHDVLQSDPTLAAVPILAVTQQNDRAARLAALAGGVDEVLSQPVNDMILQARIRSLIRARNSAEELRLRDTAPGSVGFAEAAPAAFAPSAQVALVTRDDATGASWQTPLKTQAHHKLSLHQMGDIHGLMSDPVPDAIVLELSRKTATSGLGLMADLQARSATQHAAIIAVIDPPNPRLAAEALDRGAHDVMQAGFCGEELAIRLNAQLRRKARSDGLRDSVRDGLRAALHDPMTGLFNRRYALPELARIARRAQDTGSRFAVMLADLDHFKRINDQYGHLVGDAVLIETADRLRNLLGPDDLIARVGGEEFMIVMPVRDQSDATKAADQMCREINQRPFYATGCDDPIHLTTSIGVVVSPAKCQAMVPDKNLESRAMIGHADRALYVAKDSGRNQVTLVRPAA